MNLNSEHIKKDLERFHLKMGYECNINNPNTHNEKVMRYKYTSRDPKLTWTADKIRVKSYINNLIPGNTLLENRFTTYFLKDLDEKVLQPPCVLKMNHGSGYNMFRFDDSLSVKEIINTLDPWSKSRYGVNKGEWCYDNIVPGVIVEPVLFKGNHMVYRFLTFSGKVKHIHAHEYEFKDKSGKILPIAISCSTYTRNWSYENVQYKELDNYQLPKPKNLGEMISIAEKLGDDLPFVRIDLYDLGHRIEFSEMTHYPVSGKCKFTPYEFDLMLGECW